MALSKKWTGEREVEPIFLSKFDGEIFAAEGRVEFVPEFLLETEPELNFPLPGFNLRNFILYTARSGVLQEYTGLNIKAHDDGRVTCVIDGDLYGPMDE